jgi:hypothetical protein
LFQSRHASAAESDGLALAQVLAKSGFRTAAFTGGGNVSSRLGFGRGLEVYEESPNGLEESLSRAASWLRQHRQERFFLFLHTDDIHLPYDPPEPHASMFTESYSGTIRGDNTREILRVLRHLDGQEGDLVELAPLDRERVVALYDGGLHYTDAQLEHFFDLTSELDLDRDTLVIFISDHGEEFWDHGSVIHSHTLYQELLHVPLLIRAPGIVPTRIAATISLMDLAPTILELLEIPLPVQFEGRSLLGLIRGIETADRLIISEQRGLKGWMEYPWKLVRRKSQMSFNSSISKRAPSSEPTSRSLIATSRSASAQDSTPASLVSVSAKFPSSSPVSTTRNTSIGSVLWAISSEMSGEMTDSARDIGGRGRSKMNGM